MNKKLLLVAGLVIAGLIILIFLLGPGQEGSKTDGGIDISGGTNTPADYKDAPPPTGDVEQMEQIRNLWPDAFEKKTDKKEAVIKEWKELAAKYPKNFYIPDEFKPALSDEEKAEKIKRMNTFLAVESQSAALRAKLKYAPTGATPPAATEGVTAEQQKVYFEYRINELESRIQLLEFAMDRQGLDKDQVASAAEDMEKWRVELKELKKVQASITTDEKK